MQEYNEKSIEVLEGLEGIRVRPGMYIGGTGTKALHHLIFEIVDNSVDEALSGNCNKINVTILKDGGVCIEDNGRGIPVLNHPKFNKPTVEIIFSTLHSGGKFSSQGYSFSGGLHGVGLAVVNALSTKTIVDIKRDGFEWHLELSKGNITKHIVKGKKTKETGTKITFYPDEEIFETTTFIKDVIVERIKEICFLNPILTFNVADLRESKEIETYHFENGITDFIAHLTASETTILKEPIYFKHDNGNVLECAIQFSDNYNENVYSFVNNIKTTDGGTHEIGFKNALTKVINDLCKEKGLIKEKDSLFTGDDIREGIYAIVNYKIKEPEFEGQTKSKLANTSAKQDVENTTYQQLYQLLFSNKQLLTTIHKKAKEALTAREHYKKEKEISKKKNKLQGETISSKLAQCSSKKPEECELYIVEGDSAGGSAKQGRNRNNQAILPLRGKILNSEKQRLLKLLSNNEIKTMINAIDAGIGKDFNVSKIRYHKIIIMTDADVDGEHIRTLLLTFFYRYMKDLITNGNVYIAKPPLYQIIKGKKEYFAYSETEKNNIIKKNENVIVKRYKGLGEMNPDQLWETTMNPENRLLIRVTENDAILSNKMFSDLMGDNVEIRKEFIQKNSHKAVL